MLSLAGSSCPFLVMVTMEEVRDPALSGRNAVLITEVKRDQTQLLSGGTDVCLHCS